MESSENDSSGPALSKVLVRLIQLALLIDVIGGLLYMRWPLVFVGLVTIVLTEMPQRFARWMGVRLPPSFLVMVAIFITGTIFLGEIYDFYERYWWWDIALHLGSAVSFGLFGFLFIFMLFEGDRYAAPPIAVAFLSFCVAMTIGAIWEIFEFLMDTTFGLNMQKSGLPDTMGDLMVDMAGGLIGAGSGFLYLKGRDVGPLHLIGQFVAMNRRFFGKLRG